MIQLIETYGVLAYAITIFFGGIWGVKFVPFNWGDVYKFGLFSTIVGGIFILLEIYVSKTFVVGDSVNYLLTYTVVTSCYEWFGKYLFEKWGMKSKKED